MCVQIATPKKNPLEHMAKLFLSFQLWNKYSPKRYQPNYSNKA